MTYAEPLCPELASELRRRDIKDLQQHGYVVRPSCHTTPSDVSEWTWGVGQRRRFNDEGERLTRPKTKSRVSPSPAAASSRAAMMRSASPSP